MPQQTIKYGPEAIAYWREHGGALRYICAAGSEPGYWEAWWDAAAMEAEMPPQFTAKGQTWTALRMAGLTSAEVDALMADWQD